MTRAFIALVACLLSRSAMAQPLDLGTETCAAYLSFVVDGMNDREGLNRTTVAIHMSWIYGYLAGEHKSSRMDTARFNPLMKLIGDKCQARPKTGLLVIAEEAWVESEPPSTPPPQ